MDIISTITATIFIIGLLILSVAWGILFKIGLRILLPFKVEHLKTERHFCFLAFFICIVSPCATISTLIGAITIIKLMLFG